MCAAFWTSEYFFVFELCLALFYSWSHVCKIHFSSYCQFSRYLSLWGCGSSGMCLLGFIAVLFVCICTPCSHASNRLARLSGVLHWGTFGACVPGASAFYVLLVLFFLAHARTDARADACSGNSNRSLFSVVFLWFCVVVSGTQQLFWFEVLLVFLSCGRPSCPLTVLCHRRVSRCWWMRFSSRLSGA